MIDWKAFQKSVIEALEPKLQKLIEDLPSHSSDLQAAMNYSLTSGGKRVRPFLVYATGQILNVDKRNLDICAIAIECIHAYSLVHDDLPAMDDDDLRRGSPTCHIAFDEATAILAGDALQTLAFDVLANYPAPAKSERLELIAILSRAAGYQGMCGGQAMDLAATNQTISQTHLKDIHQLKTGALIQACIQMVVSLANLPEQESAELSTYAGAIGLAFQVKDDILDVVSDTETLGKPQGSDAELNKSTYPELLGLDGAEKYLQQLHQQALQALAAIPYNTELLEAFTDYVVHRAH